MPITPMKSIAALCLGLGLAALSGAASAQSANRSFEARYVVIARGLEAGEFNYNFRQTGGSYTASATREMTGIARALLGENQDYTYSVRGSVAENGALRPSVYQHQGGRRRDDRPNGRLIRAEFGANDVVTTASPGFANMGDPPATQAQRRGTIDQITAIATMLTTAEDPCARTLHIYMDGRARFDFALSSDGSVNVNSRAYRGPGLRCRVAFRPIAGFGDPQDPATLTFVFGRGPAGTWVPVTIEMPADGVGVVRLEARSLNLNGTALR